MLEHPKTSRGKTTLTLLFYHGIHKNTIRKGSVVMKLKIRLYKEVDNT